MQKNKTEEEELCRMDLSHLLIPRGQLSEQQDQNIHPPYETHTSTSLDMYTHTHTLASLMPIWQKNMLH